MTALSVAFRAAIDLLLVEVSPYRFRLNSIPKGDNLVEAIYKETVKLLERFVSAANNIEAGLDGLVSHGIDAFSK